MAKKRKPRRSDYPIPIVEAREVIVGWRILCPSCDKEFQAKRSDATYCSPDCRHKAYRDRKRRAQR